LSLLQSESRGLPNSWEKVVGFAVGYLLKHRDCHGVGKEYLVRWLDKNARDMWVMDKNISDDLLQYLWTKTNSDVQSKIIDVSIIGPKARAYKRTCYEGWGGHIDIDHFGIKLYRNSRFAIAQIYAYINIGV